MARIYKKYQTDVRRETDSQVEPFYNIRDNKLYYVDYNGFLVPLTQGDGSIYLSDGTLTGDRTLTGAANYLHFNSLSNFTVGTSADINLDPGGEVAIADTKSITADNPTGSVVAIKCRTTPTVNIGFVGTLPMQPPTTLNINAPEGVTINSDNGGGGASKTTIKNGSAGLEINRGLAFYTGTGNNIAAIDAGVDETLVTKEWVNTGNGGIYGGSGSLIGPTVVTTGADDLTFTATTGDILFNNNVAPNPTLIIDGATNTIGMGGNATLAEQLSIYNTTGSGNTTALGIYGNNTTGNQRAAYINTTAAATNNTALQVNASGAATGNYALLVEAGNVGIGVLTPTETVQIGELGNVATLKFVDGNQTLGHVLTSDANGVATWGAPTGVAASIYTNSGTVPTTTIATITDTLNFNGGKVGINVAPAGPDDFQVSGGTLLDALNINSAYSFPIAAGPPQTGQALTYDGAGSLVFAATGTDTGNTVWVDAVNGNDGTGTRGEQDKPFLTILAAIAAATRAGIGIPGDLISVRPGIYPETATLDITGLSLVSTSGWENTTIGDVAAAYDIITVGTEGYLQGFSILVPSLAHSAVECNQVGGTNSVYDVAFYGTGTTGLGTGINRTGGGKTIGSNIRVEGGGMANALRVDSGVLALEGVHVPNSPGTIDNVLLCTVNVILNTGGRAQMFGFNTGSPNVTNAIRTEDGVIGLTDNPTALIFTPNIFNCTNALSTDGVYQTSNLLGGRIENVTYAVAVSLLATGVGLESSIYRITSNHQPKYLYNPETAGKSEFTLIYTQDPSEVFDSSFNIFGANQISAGIPEKGVEASFGKGSPYTTGLMCAVAQDAGKVLTETLLLGGTGYTNGDLNVGCTGGTGVQMTVDITTAGPVGPVTGVVLNDPGSGYTAGDVVTITGGGADATVTINTVEKDGSAITDKTAEAISKSGSSFVQFPTNAAGDVIYLGSLRKDVSSNPLKFYGIETLVASGAIGNINDYVFEIADGSGNWVVVNTMGTSAEEGYPYGKAFFKRTGIKEFYRLGITNTTSYTPADFYKVTEFDWTPNLITLDSGTFPNGLTTATAYWLRIRTRRDASAPSLVYPFFERFKLIDSTFNISKNGVPSGVGLGMFRKTISLSGRVWSSSLTGGMTPTVDLGLYAEITGNTTGDNWLHEINYSVAVAGDSLSVQFPIPIGTCTAFPIKIKCAMNFEGAINDLATNKHVIEVYALPQTTTGNLIADPAGGTTLVRRNFTDADLLSAAGFRDPNLTTLTIDGTNNIIEGAVGGTLWASLANKVHEIELCEVDVSSLYENDLILMNISFVSGSSNLTPFSLIIEGVFHQDGAGI